jgi:hypothetical protein
MLSIWTSALPYWANCKPMSAAILLMSSGAAFAARARKGDPRLDLREQHLDPNSPVHIHHLRSGSAPCLIAIG